MSKATVTRLFVGGVVATVAGIVFGLGALGVALAGGAFLMSGPDVTGITSSSFAWAMVGLVLVGVLAIIGGSIAGLVAWIGALLNTAQLNDKTWFVVLLMLGIWNLGFIALIAYVIAGPDGLRQSADRSAPGVNVGPAHA
jgi:hypothetical protein